ncbi:hypothetical protein G6F38_008742 [Rhizopus arrhizus]|nr:hypothetical protein G6F38_008742 [Rhizopus arrhizus]
METPPEYLEFRHIALGVEQGSITQQRGNLAVDSLRYRQTRQEDDDVSGKEGKRDQVSQDFSYVAGTIDNDEARYKIFSLLRKTTGSNRAVLRCVQAVLPGTFSSAVSAISEAELLASHVHPFMQALFSGWEPQRVPHASDKVFSDDNITNNARPDYIVDVYQQADVRYANVIGELKVEGVSKREIAKDFCRVALLTKEVIGKHKLTAAMGFQALGHRLTFYVMTLMYEKVYMFTEVCTIELPRTTADLLQFLTHLNDIYVLSMIYNYHCSTQHENTRALPIERASFSFLED